MRIVATGVFAVVLASVVFAQNAPRPAFDVVSIKRSSAVEHGGGRSGPQPGGRFVMTNGPTRVLLNTAYKTETNEIFGAPGWVTSDNYDVEARAGHDLSSEELALRLQSLLADRFKLKAHLEKRIRPIYELHVLRSDGVLGPAMRRSAIDCEAQRGVCKTDGGDGVIESNGAWIPAFITWLPYRVGRPVLDKTGLDGYYELKVTWAVNAGDAGPALPTALREQLGLTLVPVDAPMDVLVIDHIERPSEN